MSRDHLKLVAGGAPHGVISPPAPTFQAPEYYPAGAPNKIIVRDPETAAAVERWLLSRRVVIFDFETSGLAWYRDARIIGAAFAAWDDEGRLWNYYLPFRHRTGELQLEEAVVLSIIRNVLATGALKVGHNVKFDEHFARADGARLGGRRYCTMVASNLYDENFKLNLEARVERFLGVQDPEYWGRYVQHELELEAAKRNLSKSKFVDQTGYSYVPINLLGTYACFDTEHAAGLYSFYENDGLSRRYERVCDIEMRLIEPIVDMEETGLLVDVEYLEGLRDRVKRARTQYRERIAAELGSRFNPGSDQELQALIYGVYRQPVIRKTKNKQPSVDDETLEYFENQIPVLRLVRKFREADKIASTYTDSILDKMDANNVIHPNFKQVGTVTGRLACEEPNLQNIASDSDERALEATGKKLEDGGVDPWSVRRAFIVPPGRRRICADYSQAELRVIAFYTNDPIMREVYRLGEDLHAKTQAGIKALCGRDIPRRLAKIIAFGIAYGMTVIGLQRRAKISMEDAELFFNAFFERYATIIPFRENLAAEARQRPGCTTTNIFGQMRRLPKLASHVKHEHRRAERQQMSTIIQGTAAWLMKESMVRIHERIKAENLPADLVNTVHDEAQVDVDIGYEAEVAKLVVEEMEDFPELHPIPMVVDVDMTSTSWPEKTSYDWRKAA